MNAILILTGLLQLASQAADSAKKLGDLMETAEKEGRDLTPEELAPFIEARKDAEDAWINKE